MKTYIVIVLIAFHSILHSSDTLPIAIEATIPRHAIVSWNSEINWNQDQSTDIAVLYHVPIIGQNDSIKYLEFFSVSDDGSARVLDRICLGGRGSYEIDRVEGKEGEVILYAREHQALDPISTPSIKVTLIAKYKNDLIAVSKVYDKNQIEQIGVSND